ncbi:hypothetical protein Q1M63_03175 (plasmid) [Sinorhizobium meliloti]|nr:hypothetical protein Q1M63_03175 [Sinorhizobium meliloti]
MKKRRVLVGHEHGHRAQWVIGIPELLYEPLGDSQRRFRRRRQLGECAATKGRLLAIIAMKIMTHPNYEHMGTGLISDPIVINTGPFKLHKDNNAPPIRPENGSQPDY